MSTTLFTLQAAADEALEALAEHLTAAAALTESGAATSTQLRAVGSSMADARIALREVRVDFDALDAGAQVSGTRPRSQLALWLWQREARWALLEVERQALEGEALVERLVQGDEETQVLVRAGDSWQRLAARHLGDWREWPRLVEVNQGSVSSLTPGTVITIPRRR